MVLWQNDGWPTWGRKIMLLSTDSCLLLWPTYRLCPFLRDFSRQLRGLHLWVSCLRRHHLRCRSLRLHPGVLGVPRFLGRVHLLGCRLHRGSISLGDDLSRQAGSDIYRIKTGIMNWSIRMVGKVVDRHSDENPRRN